MLTALSISNIVLIDKLNLEFGAGLNVLTGETGAGKSILMDALALALGARSDTGLIRHGCDTASVVAEFLINNEQLTINNLLSENGIDFEGQIILRRTLTTDSKNRTWINDVPVSVKTLKAVGDALAEIHGQFENHSLLDPATHRRTLDLFGNYNDLLNDVRASYNEFYATSTRLRELTELIERSAAEREFLEHNVVELQKLNPQIGEEEDLANRRAIMMGAEKNAAILNDAATASKGLDTQIFNVAHILERIKTDPNPYQNQIDELYRVAQTIGEIDEQLTPADIDTDTLESVEERLFAIRAVARKHRVTGDELAAKLIQMSEQLNAIDNSDAELAKVKSELKIKKLEFENRATELTAARVAAGAQMRDAMLRELPDLKLAGADFKVEIEPGSPTVTGTDIVTFMIKMNPGAPFAPLHKTASGGELARLMLALRVVLRGGNGAGTLVFDEVDTGISGATASAVGERLNRLAFDAQMIVITHSAQVAGYADKHFKISKNVENDTTTTSVCEIADDARLNEIARIISGASVTPESLATAKTLIK